VVVAFDAVSAAVLRSGDYTAGLCFRSDTAGLGTGVPGCPAGDNTVDGALMGIARNGLLDIGAGDTT
jgi:hypothetical protein